MQGRILGGAIGAIAPLKPKKVNLSTMILYNSENNILDVRLFVVHCLNCFVTTVLQSILHLSYSSIAVMRLDCQILLKLPPPLKLPGWICPWYDATTANHLLVQSVYEQHCCP